MVYLYKTYLCENMRILSSVNDRVVPELDRFEVRFEPTGSPFKSE